MDIVVEGAAGIVAGIVGREPELEVLRGFFGADGSGRALVLSGEAGIGKTTVWNAGVTAARERLYWVLSCRPVEAETKLGFAALGDLLDPVLDETLPQLPAPQRRALEIALLRVDAEGPAPEPRAVAFGVLSVLRALAALAPTRCLRAFDPGPEVAQRPQCQDEIVRLTRTRQK